MATNNSTATTPEEFAEQFPCTARPFAVWYNPDPNANHLKWAVNNESGEASEEFEDMATALKAAAEMGREWADEARIQAQALAKVSEHYNIEGGTTADIIQTASDYCYSMSAFFDLAEREIKEHGSTDLDGIEFLVKGAKAELFRFSELVCKIQDEREVHHA